MIFLRIVRAALIFFGIGTTALGIILIAFDARVTGGPVSASWSCESQGSGASARMVCRTDRATYSGPGGLVETLGYLGLTIGGVGLIGAAVALGQFDRTRISTAPASGPAGPPMGPPPGPPLPPPGHGPQGAQGRPGAW